MSTTNSPRRGVRLTTGYLGNVVLAGVAAGVLMGFIMHQIMGVMQAVGALYTVESTAAGWLFHLIHAAIFGVVFGGFFMWGRITPYVDDVLPSTVLGVTWGLALWVFAAGVLMPTWLAAVGAPAPDIPAWNPWSGVGHVVYGVVLGGGAAVLHGRFGG